MALEEASSINAQQNAQIERLSTALTTAQRPRRPQRRPAPRARAALRSEIDALRNKTREQAILIDRLQVRLGHGYLAARRRQHVPRSSQARQPPAPLAAAEGDMDRLRKDLSEAEAALSAARTAGGNEAEAIRAGMEREIRGLKARAEDQAGEIARLRAALSAFEQYDGKSIGSLRQQQDRPEGATGLGAGAGRPASVHHHPPARRAGGCARAPGPPGRAFHGRDAPHRRRHGADLGPGAPAPARQRARPGRAGLANHEDAAPCHRRECHGKRYNHDRCHRHGAGRACRRRAAQAGQQRSQRYYHCGSCGRWCNPGARRETKFRGSCRRNAQSD